MPGKSKGDLVLSMVCTARSGGADSLVRSLYSSRVSDRKGRLAAERVGQATANVIRIKGLRSLAYTRIA